MVVEMKNDIEITGLLEEVDFSMNLTLGNVRQVTAQVLSLMTLGCSCVATVPSLCRSCHRRAK